MAKLNMILADGSTTELAEFSLPMHAVVLAESKDAALSVWAMLTAENLATVQIEQGGEVIFGYRNAALSGVQYMLNGDDTVTAHFYMDGEKVPNPDSEYAEAGKILLGEVEW